MISTSAYTGYIETTKISQAISQIKVLSFLIDDYADENGQYPESLRDIGNHNLKDPWGSPYVYFNLARSSGNDNEHGGGHDSDDGDSEHGGGHDNDNDNEDNGNHGGHDNDNEHGNNSDINIGGARKDRNLTPINTKYDLCSSGKDGKSKPPLTAKDSHDDIIYANDGGYIGMASDF